MIAVVVVLQKFSLASTLAPASGSSEIGANVTRDVERESNSEL
jgi:hypothetical protein